MCQNSTRRKALGNVDQGSEFVNSIVLDLAVDPCDSLAMASPIAPIPKNGTGRSIPCARASLLHYCSCTATSGVAPGQRCSRQPAMWTPASGGRTPAIWPPAGGVADSRRRGRPPGVAARQGCGRPPAMWPPARGVADSQTCGRQLTVRSPVSGGALFSTF